MPKLLRIFDRMFDAAIVSGDRAYSSSPVARASREAGRLARLSDLQLASIRLSRAQIVPHAFKSVPLY